jgi:radical SAM superfamily enzyme YgiQ (UPF0313 family)
VVFTGPRALIHNLDELPFPARDQLAGTVARGGHPEEIYLTGSRGCPYRCSFCDIKTFYQKGTGPGWRGRSPENLGAELTALAERYGVTPTYVFVDDQFVGPGPAGKRRCVAFAEVLKKAKLGVSFEITCRADAVDSDVLTALKEAGLSGVYLGLDSGSESVLRRYQKDLTIETNLRAAQLVRDLDIPLDFGFIMFDPWTEPDELDASLEFLGQLAALGFPLHRAHFLNTLKLYPNTPIAERAVDRDVSEPGRQSWVHSIQHAFSGVLSQRADDLCDPTGAAAVIADLRNRLSAMAGT